MQPHSPSTYCHTYRKYTRSLELWQPPHSRYAAVVPMVSTLEGLHCMYIVGVDDCFSIPFSSTSLNFSISVRTELGTDFKIPAEASLFWPHLFAQQTLEFSPTTVGNSTVSDLPCISHRSSIVTVTTMYAYSIARS